MRNRGGTVPPPLKTAAGGGSCISGWNEAPPVQPTDHQLLQPPPPSEQPHRGTTNSTDRPTANAAPRFPSCSWGETRRRRQTWQRRFSPRPTSGTGPWRRRIRTETSTGRQRAARYPAGGHSTPGLGSWPGFTRQVRPLGVPWGPGEWRGQGSTMGMRTWSCHDPLPTPKLSP